MSIKEYRKAIYFLPLFFLSLGGIVQAQITIRGTIFDQETNSPIPYASIYVENTFIGVKTGEEGIFSLELRAGLQGNIIISSMGYNTKTFSVDDFTLQGKEIFLTPTTHDLIAFDIAAKKVMTNPRGIVYKAIKRIPKNMAIESIILTATYQQSFQQYDTDKVVNVSMQKVNIHLDGIKNKNKTDSITVVKKVSENVFWENFRYNDDVLLPQYQIPDYGTEHLQCLLRMDPVRNYQTPTFDFVERLDKDFINNHFFMLDSIGVYNGENVYCITVFLLNKIRYQKVNPISGNFRIGNITYWLNLDGEYSHTPIGLSYTYLKQKEGIGASIPIGKIKITTKELAINYFEYTNGFGNDRYKYIAEYTKKEGKYYPSKIYFANKFRMKPQPNFTKKGDDPQEGLKCLMSKKYYEQTKKKFSKTTQERSIIKQIITDHTINCSLSSYTRNRQKKYVTEVKALTKIVEEIQDTFLYNDYQKYLHHRLVMFELRDSSSQDKQSDFSSYYYPLGDRTFHWNAYSNPKQTSKHSEKDLELSLNALKNQGDYFYYGYCYTPHYSFAHISDYYAYSSSSGMVWFPKIPVPITSSDEYRYVIKNPENPYIYDKAHLIKGIVQIW